MLANEKPENAVTREVEEETGLKALSVIPFSSKGKFTYDKKTQRERGAKGFIWKLYATEVRKDGVKISKREHDGFKWLSYAKAIRQLRWPNQKKSLKIVHKTLKKV